MCVTMGGLDGYIWWYALQNALSLSFSIDCFYFSFAPMVTSRKDKGIVKPILTVFSITLLRWWSHERTMLIANQNRLFFLFHCSDGDLTQGQWYCKNSFKCYYTLSQTGDNSDICSESKFSEKRFINSYDFTNSFTIQAKLIAAYSMFSRDLESMSLA